MLGARLTRLRGEDARPGVGWSRFRLRGALSWSSAGDPQIEPQRNVPGASELWVHSQQWMTNAVSLCTIAWRFVFSSTLLLQFVVLLRTLLLYNYSMNRWPGRTQEGGLARGDLLCPGRLVSLGRLVRLVPI